MARPTEGNFLGVPILHGGSGFASGQLQQVETNSGISASSSSSLPTTIASADRARFLVILQTPIKSVLAKEEWEESEAKLREAIEISKGAIPRHCR